MLFINAQVDELSDAVALRTRIATARSLTFRHRAADAGLVAAQDDYFNGDFLQDIAEKRLLDLGGHALWQDARHEAGAYVDERYPWDGFGDEPPERVSAYIGVLWQRGDAAEPATARAKP